jgi:FAD/FMN-containing dehydrogenase
MPGADLSGLPADIVFTDPADLAPHLVDWRGAKRGDAAALLLPRSTAEVQQIVRWAGANNVALVPQGGNTGLVGAGVPEAAGARPCVVLSMRRLNRISQIDPRGLSLVAEAGVVLQDLQQAAEQAGCRFPLSLGAKGSATVGGLVSTNAGGVQVLRHGPMRSLVLGLEAVLPDGSLLNQLSALRKDNTGYDVKQLLIGAEGTLGVVTRVALKLAPAFTDVSTAWAAVPSAEAALALLARLRSGLGERVESFELLSADTLALVVRQLPGTRAPIAAGSAFHVLLEAEAPEAAIQQLLVQAVEAGEVEDAVFASSRGQAEALWAIRENVAIAERQEGKSVKNDISIPIERIAAFDLEAIQLFAQAMPGARPLVFGHLGDGNLHWNLLPPAGEDSGAWVEANGEAARRLLHDLIARYDGSISAEHGIGTLKAAELARLGDPGKLRAMQAVKAALDPQNILNPGKLFA